MVLYLTVFTSGACLMGLELLAARVLAPVMGNSIFVWGSVISSVMIALSLGYWLGGRLADRLGASRTLGPVIAGAGVLTVAIPLVTDAVLLPAAELGPRLGPLVASTAIFFAPCLLLAMVSPLGVRAEASRGLAHIGRSAGSLYSVSTAGSIVGTLATSFWLIPLFQVEPLIVGIGMVLFLAALATMSLPVLRPETPAEGTAPPSESVARVWMASLLALCVAGGVFGIVMIAKVTVPPSTNEFGEAILFRQDTQYHRITVTEADGVRNLRFDNSRQSAVDIETGFESMIAYPSYFHLCMTLRPDAERVLVLGLGGGTTTKRMWRDYSWMRIDSVEIDPVVLDVAERYFGLPQDERLAYFVQDARRYVQTTDERYDIVIVDAYYADRLPAHLTTEEFFEEVAEVLEPDGVVVYNIISAPEGPRSELFRSMYRTASGVWDHIWVFPIGLHSSGPEARCNIVVLATDLDITEEELLDRIAERVDGIVTIEGFDGFGADLYTDIVEMADVPTLTDAYSPTDELIVVQ